MALKVQVWVSSESTLGFPGFSFHFVSSIQLDLDIHVHHEWYLELDRFYLFYRVYLCKGAGHQKERTSQGSARPFWRRCSSAVLSSRTYSSREACSWFVSVIYDFTCTCNCSRPHFQVLYNVQFKQEICPRKLSCSLQYILVFQTTTCVSYMYTQHSYKSTYMYMYMYI